MIGLYFVMALLGLMVLFFFAHLPVVAVVMAGLAVLVALLTAFKFRTRGVDT